MSTVVLDTITGKSTATTITIGSTPVVSASANSMTIRGEGSAQTSIQQGLVKEWNLFDQAGNIHGANTLGDSFNVSSAADVSTGHYDVNFTNNMNSTAYCPVSNHHYTGALAHDQYSRFSAPSNLATSSYRIAGQYVNGSSEDGYFTVGTTGDLA